MLDLEPVEGKANTTVTTNKGISTLAEQQTPLMDSGEEIRPRTHVVRSDSRLLGEIIAQYTNISPLEVEAALDRCRETGLLLGEQLIQDGKLTSEDRARCLAIQWGLPFCDLRHARISVEAANILDHDYQRNRNVLLLQVKNGLLYVGLVNPLKVDVLDDVRLITGCDVKPVMVSESALQEKYEQIFGPLRGDDLGPDGNAPGDGAEPEPPESIEGLVENVKTELELQNVGIGDATDDVHDLRNAISEAAVIRLVNSILIGGIERKASDIHLQAERNGVLARYRVDGILHDGPVLPKSMLRVLIARLKVMANLDLAVRRTPQDGRMSLRIADRQFEVRLSILPSARGAKAVMRVAEQDNELVGLERLGFQPQVLDKFRSLIQRPHGMLLITGPTGSGKSTTLYSALAELNSPERNILTVEDPVESQLDRVTQAEINERAGLSFAACLRAALRQDPDIIMVGEIRDTETAMIATQASLTGHLVLSTLHTNDAPSAITRLIDMGIEPFLVGSSVVGVLAQRLARKLCANCCEPFEPSPRELRGLNLELPGGGPVQLKRPVGCEACHDTGHRGRIGIYELLGFSDSIRDLVLDGRPDSAIREQAIREGMATLKDDASLKLVAAETSLEEAHRVVFFSD